uniref:DUF569 domain-containing protein n=1 Tax=Oryza barthii TaxID=65489 RepID=A0A0D3FQA9_9ORYZ
MELFARAQVVRLKSHHDKFLYADEDEVHVTQDRNGAATNARWTVERVPHSPGVVRLRSRYGRYLSASNEPFLLGMTGRKVLQAPPPGGRATDSSLEWEPVKDGFQAKLKTRYGHYLRANRCDDKGDVDEDDETRSFTFNGSNLEELTHKLQEETGLHDIIICTRSPITGKLAPLRLQLPPNNAAMHIVLVQESSKVDNELLIK